VTAERPKVRIIHPGGPATMAQVWIDDHQLTCVTRVEIAPLDVDSRGPVMATLTVIDPEIALEAELAELYVRELPTETAGP
jgi:hypothetical protein